MNKYSQFNAEQALKEVNRLLNCYSGPYLIEYVCKELSIFDWWPRTLSKSRLNQMKSFLTQAIKRGYKGYVCFKVGDTGCANGMWAHKEESTNGYSPDGDCLYHSFTPEYTYWSVNQNGTWYPTDRQKFDSVKTLKQLDALYESLN